MYVCMCVPACLYIYICINQFNFEKGSSWSNGVGRGLICVYGEQVSQLLIIAL